MSKDKEKQEGIPLKAIREFLDMTQTEFGYLLGGVDSGVISRRERTNSAALSWPEVRNLDLALKEKGKRFSDFESGDDDTKKDA